MIRTLWFFLKVAVVIAAALWLADRPGVVRVDWQGWHVETSVGMALLAALVGVVAVALGYRMWRALRTAPGHWSRSRRLRKRERGYKALTQGMVAVAAGDASAAMRLARQADDLLADPPLTLLLSAQATQLMGDETAATRYFQAMLERPETAFLGVRGLLTQALRRGDAFEALKLARQADGLQPRTPWVLLVLADLEARAGEWLAAERVLQTAIDSKALSREEGRRRQAALLVERSRQTEAEGRADAALAQAQSAVDLAPAFAPAVARLARLQVTAGRHKLAAKVVERAWRVAPHPALAEAYALILAAYDPDSRLVLMRKLENATPAGNLAGKVELALATGRQAIAAGQWAQARALLETALADEPSNRVLRALADLEKAENGDGAAVKEWLAKAAAAPSGPLWVCRECGVLSADWHGLCARCGAFDAQEWKTPEALNRPVMVLHPEISTLPPGALPPSRALVPAS